jgi:hypothetical protein
VELGRITMADRVPRRQLQFSLRTLLGITLLFSAFMSWFAVAMRQAHIQRDARVALQRLAGAHYYWDYQFDRSGHQISGASAPSPAWLRALLGEDFFHNVVWTFLFGVDGRITDDELAHLKGFSRLRLLDIKAANITDAGLVHLQQLDGLEDLTLESVPVTDAGLLHIGRITSLTYLNLYDTPITDAGLKHLTGLHNLKTLCVQKTNVTAQGAASLQEALPDLQIVQ